MAFIKVNNVELHYQLLGQGEITVVFLHGLVMDNLSSWFFTVANAVAQNFQVLLYDLRGHGYSEKPKEGYSLSNHVQDLTSLLTALNITTPVIIVGNSFGGLLALQFAIKCSRQVQGLVLVDAQINDDAWKIKMVQSLGSTGDTQRLLIEKNFQNWQGKSSNKKSNRLADHAKKLIEQTDLVACLRTEVTITTQELSSVTIPTYAIYGGESEELAVSKMLETYLPNCTLKVFAGCSHSILWERTEEIKDLILQFVNVFSTDYLGKDTLQLKSQSA